MYTIDNDAILEQDRLGSKRDKLAHVLFNPELKPRILLHLTYLAETSPLGHLQNQTCRMSWFGTRPTKMTR